ncbi:MAG: vanadium-dependent haloperoxidase [Planctomycetes bacterium]|nr:vanadium-dependent haloperoxidase [Planctomycetota bacterium]
MDGVAPRPTNGDESLYPDRIASYTKSLPHNAFGEVDVNAYTAFMTACANKDQLSFEFIPSGQPNSLQRMKLVNPLGGLTYDLEGVDACNTTMPPPPTFASARMAGEIVENYWMALLRDIPFSQYATHPLVAQACADLSLLSDFFAPKVGGSVTPATLFRDAAPGCVVGPYISQFLVRSQPIGAQYIEPKMRTVVSGVDYMTTDATWLDRQNGVRPTVPLGFDSQLRYIRNGRDLSRWVHIDLLYQAYFQAMLAMLAAPDATNPFTGGGLGVPPNIGNPYSTALMQDGFASFGGPKVQSLLCEVGTRALHGCWFQKWFVHRSLRPEVYAGRVHHKLANGRPYPIHADVLNSGALALIQSANGGRSYLPQVFPEGSPAHPSFPSGHATVAGACVTILKALFHTDVPYVNPVVPSDDGLTLLSYTGPGATQMTVGGELNKLAMNVAYGRNIAGVHWRADAYESMRLGEAIAISVLRDQRETYVENFNGFTFKKFDGTTIVV